MNAQQLKNSILQLAVQGKLVPQDPNDEPASELLKRIKVEKEKLIKEKKIKAEKNPSEIFRGSDNLPYEKIGNEVRCIADEVPFEIPESWEWVRLGNIGDWGSGATPSRTNSAYYNGNIPWLKTGDLTDGYIYEIPENITELALKETSVRLNPAKSVLIAMYGATIGKLGILTFPATTNQACCACLPYNGIYNEFLFYFLMAQKKSFIKQGEGGAQPNISKEKIVATFMPVPPLAEQQRIVDKLKELEPYINDYDKAYEKIETLNNNFPEQLKKSILQDAVQGKLVPQNPNDEPASVLIEQIRKEKEQLIKEKKIKKDKNESYIFRRDNSYYEKFDEKEVCIDDKIPFDIPNNWIWTRLGNILIKLTDGTHSTPKYTTTGIHFLSVKDMSGGVLDFSDTKFISIKEHNELYKRCDPELGDLLLTKVGTTGIPVIVDTEKEFSLFVSVALLKFNQKLIYNEYLKFLILSPLVQLQAKENTKGVGNKNWVMRDIANTLIAIPPLAEQYRIVETLKNIFKPLNKLHL